MKKKNFILLMVAFLSISLFAVRVIYNNGIKFVSAKEADINLVTEGDTKQDLNSVESSEDYLEEISTDTGNLLENEVDSKKEIEMGENVEESNIIQEATKDLSVDNSEETVDSWMPDKNLQSALSAILKIPANEIKKEDLLKLDKPPYNGLTGMGISSIEGLQYAKNVTRLSLTGNHISDVTPLAELEKLQLLWLDKNEISDVTPIANLKQYGEIKGIFLEENNIVDISPLAVYEGYPLNGVIGNTGGLWLGKQTIILPDITIDDTPYQQNLMPVTNLEANNQRLIPTSDSAKGIYNPNDSSVTWRDFSNNEGVFTTKWSYKLPDSYSFTTPDFTGSITQNYTIKKNLTSLYEVTIPATVDLNDSSTINISGTNYGDKTLTVASKETVLTLVNEDRPNRSLDAPLTWNNPENKLTVSSGDGAQITADATITMGVPKKNVYAGKYKGILNFVITYE
ncbi:hypothetical protein CKN86_06530 [Carnobacterium divergens]|uniref:leucine-rich repeat domain-containing protein n=1 Tax=Carnobacterium divergens TaxID=2748 RepID=UPI000D4BF1D4|nr:leucine-rich repeat domain-containing protein [Carnobacterium divergens]MCO6016975.1 leucine-rich repeat domain-containing protein [Carnobacterium divergens]MPQ22556.1 hypothetical protein [Carnobacterium divergens]TFI62492.1 hypothetical protein CKN62_06565 [Carnobacterium divergens]TFI89694.1 hypothetical protein CKN84_06565 [Carnobacterium divergens]TFJ04749.1 hypothetical protein CKN86_06530 [Carnobacterium divergens]